MAKHYKKELRKSREDLFEAYLDKRGMDSNVLQKRVGPERFRSLRKKYLQGIQRIQNRTRGKYGEMIATALLTSNGFGEFEDLMLDEKSIETPWGRRRIDVFNAGLKLAVEVKSGYVCFSKGIRQQVLKDEFILKKTREVQRVAWIPMNGMSRNLENKLLEIGVEIWEPDDHVMTQIKNIYLTKDTKTLPKDSW